MALLVSMGAFAQSKKELQAEIAKLKQEIEELKKPKVADLTDSTQRVAYGLGILLGSNIKQQAGTSLDTEAVACGMKDVLSNAPAKMEQMEAMTIVQTYMEAAAMKKIEEQKRTGQNFLNENKAKEGVKVTGSGLQYKVVTQGKGKQPTASDNVTVHYVGTLIDGTEFDSSVKRGQPATFGLSQVISGWTEGLQLMHEGDKYIFYLPYDLGYGERGAGGQIPPFSTLIFEVELIKVN